MKTKEELKKLTGKAKEPNNNVVELTDDDLEKVAGGKVYVGPDGTVYRTSELSPRTVEVD